MSYLGQMPVPAVPGEKFGFITPPETLGLLAGELNPCKKVYLPSTKFWLVEKLSRVMSASADGIRSNSNAVANTDSDNDLMVIVLGKIFPSSVWGSGLVIGNAPERVFAFRLSPQQTQWIFRNTTLTFSPRVFEEFSRWTRSRKIREPWSLWPLFGHGSVASFQLGIAVP